MTNEFTPYIECHEGDLITAEDCNQVQVMIKEDIANQVGEVRTELNEFKEAPVDADTFDGKTPDEWKEDLDQRYALVDHSHDGIRRYRRYFLEMETVVGSVLQPAVIEHHMGRHPLVQVYELLTLPIIALPNEPLTRDYQMCFCGPAHHGDPEAADFKTKSWDERHWGDAVNDEMIEHLARELGEDQREAFKAQFKDDFTLNVWLSNLEKALFEPGPGQYHFDMGDIHRTKWVRDRASKQVSELKTQGEWPARFVYRPRHIITAPTAGSPPTPFDVDIYHLNLNEVEIGPKTNREMHLMVLMRS